VILDNMGAKYLGRNVTALATGGRLVIIGMQGGSKGELDINALLRKRGAVIATSLRARPAAEKAAICAAVVEHVWPLVAAGTIRPVVEQTLALDDVRRAHELMDEADILVHYNGDSFDIKHLNREFVEAGLAPPSPSRSVDLYKEVKKRFRFPSNKLDYVAQKLGVGGKVSHTGHKLWVDCLNQDPKAWALMRRYNIGDVRLTEKLYDRLRPWIHGHPHLGLFTGEERSCDKCGSTNLKQEGRTTTAVTAYVRFQCEDCGGWSRMNHRKAAVTMRGIK
jgi:hypothetical protein